MKALLRCGTALVGVLLLTQISVGYVWVTPVYKCPYPIAPSPCNSGFYLMDAYGRWTGPHYYLVPPCPPFNGILPGPTGAMIMSGCLPHTHLLSKEGLAIGQVPLVGDRGGAVQAQGAGSPDQNGQGGMMASPYGNPSGTPQSRGMQVPYPMPMPYGMPQGPYAGGPIPNGAMPYPMPQGPMANGPPGMPSAPLTMQPFPPFNPLQGPTPPQMNAYPPPPQKPANAFPTNPFIRGPRDFFMWGENMEDEQRLRTRPFPVPR